MKLLALILIISLTAFILYNINEDIKAIKNIKIEINSVRIEEISLKCIKLNISIKLINNESRGIKDLNGDLNVFILNVFISNISFGRVNIPAKAFKNVSVFVYLYYGEIAGSIIETIKKMEFYICLKGKIDGKIFFGLIKYEKPVEIYYEYMD